MDAIYSAESLSLSEDIYIEGHYIEGLHFLDKDYTYSESNL